MNKKDKQKAHDFLDAISDKVKITKKIHKGWEEWNKIPRSLKNKTYLKESFFGKYQYLYENSKGMISLIRIKDMGIDYNQNLYYCEIMCLKPEKYSLFPDVQRFTTKKEAEKEIYSYLGEKNDWLN